MTDETTAMSLELANIAIAKLKAEREALKAELDDHCQQLRKEQLAVQSLHEKLAELVSQEPVAWLQTLQSNGYQEVDMRPASNTDMWINEPLYAAPKPNI